MVFMEPLNHVFVRMFKFLFSCFHAGIKAEIWCSFVHITWWRIAFHCVSFQHWGVWVIILLHFLELKEWLSQNRSHGALEQGPELLKSNQISQPSDGNCAIMSRESLKRRVGYYQWSWPEVSRKDCGWTLPPQKQNAPNVFWILPAVHVPFPCFPMLFSFSKQIYFTYFFVSVCLSEGLWKSYGLILIKCWWKTAALAKGEPINFQSGSGQCFPIF